MVFSFRFQILPKLVRLVNYMPSYETSFAPVIKWSGSKRHQANSILQQFPEEFKSYYEPFVGSGAILYAASPEHAIAGDVCEPLIDLWKVIQKEPDALISHYDYHWHLLQEKGHTIFYEVRDRFNKEQNPCDFFFLSRTCVNGLIRFNKKGEFNNSLHHTRKGINPTSADKIIHQWSRRLAHVEFKVGDYRETTAEATAGDLIYLDPPYFHTRGRYYGTIDYEEFIDYLTMLNEKGIKYILSYDGSRGKKTYKAPLPENLYSRKYLVTSGNSPFKKVMDNQTELVKEALYINW